MFISRRFKCPISIGFVPIIIFCFVLQSHPIYALGRKTCAEYIKDQMTFAVYSNDKAILHVNREIKIDQPCGSKYAALKVWESQYQNCPAFKAVVKDAKGEIVREIWRRI